jgi:hypothetical protein
MNQRPDSEAREMTEDFIKKYARKRATRPAASKTTRAKS